MHIRKWYAAVFHIIVYKLCHAWSCVVNWIWEGKKFYGCHCYRKKAEEKQSKKFK